MKKLIFSVLVVVAGCVGSEPKTSTNKADLDSQNGIWENGLSTNGIWENGIWENGIWDNGIWDNGIWDNGIWDNGIWENGIWDNGIWDNGIWDNGIWENGIWDNGIWDNGIWENGIWDNGIWDNGWRADRLRNNAYAAQFLQYVYACGFPANNYDTVIGPPDALVALKGAIGVGINADNTSWWETGRCDESCQRWVSACVLARTNAYGVKVQISMRAPDTAPSRVKDALRVTSDEQAAFNLREGAYYGNIFQTTPAITAPVDYSGPALGGIQSTPKFYACAGPGSNVPEVTKRFCSSQGDNAVIQVEGVCSATELDPIAMCESIDDGGSLRNCRAGNTKYSEVITVYVKDLTEVCGNSVCEKNEALRSTCPSDCHPGGWTQTYDVNINANVSSIIRGQDGFAGSMPQMAAVAPDGSIVFGGAGGAQSIDLGSGPVASPGGWSNFVVAKVRPDQTTAWTKRFVTSYGYATPSAIDVGVDGTIALYGSPGLWVAKLAPDGTMMPGWPVTVPATSDNSNFAYNSMGQVALDPAGNVIVSGNVLGTVTMAGHVLHDGAFVAKLDATGAVKWSTVIPAAGGGYSNSVVRTDADGNVLVLQGAGWEPIGVKLDGETGVELWRTQPFYNSDVRDIGADDAGNVYVTGSHYEYLTVTFAFFLQKYSRTGTLEWEVSSPAHDPAGFGPSHEIGMSEGDHISFATNGDVVVSGEFGRGRIDFGTGWLNAFATNDAFVAAYKSDTTLPAGERRLRWIKQLPGVLNSNYFNAEVDGDNHILAAGSYSGSLSLDDRLVYTRVPESTTYVQTFVSSFGTPPENDTTPPVIQNVPRTIQVAATSPAGAVVWYMPPTATDSGYSGVTVSCDPPPNSLFSIGTHTVTCTATDPFGNASQATFLILVADTIGPSILGAPRAVHAAATSPAGAVVTYNITASDAVDGAVSVTCDHASGSTFAMGDPTFVTCTATDAVGNTTTISFPVLVDTTGDITPPALSVPVSIARTTTTTGGIVTFQTSALDDLDGQVAVTCDHVSGATYPLGSTTVTCSAHDAMGNTSTKSFTIQIDPAPVAASAPITVTSMSIVPNGAVVTYAVNTANTTCSPASGTVFLEGTTTVQCTGDNPTTFPLVVADHTAPVIAAPTGTLTLEASSASGATVSYSASATDFVDGTVAVSCSQPQGSTLPLGTETVTCTATDATGHTATSSFAIAVVDTTPPTIVVPPNITSASSVVTYSASASDLVDGVVAVTCTPASGSTFAVGTTTVTCTASDSRNHTTTSTFNVTVTTPPPVVTVPSNMTVAATSAAGAVVTYAASATGGTLSCTSPSGSTFAPGTTPVSCSATNAGGTTTQSFNVTVVFQGTFFLQPINLDGTSIFKLNSTVAVKFQLPGIANAVANLSLTKVGGSVTGSDLEAVTNGQADSGSQFRYDSTGQMYVFNLSTNPLSAGTWQLKIDLHDGTVHTVNISLKK